MTLRKWFIVLLLAYLVVIGIAWYQYYMIEDMQYRLDLYEQQPQKMWA